MSTENNDLNVGDLLGNATPLDQYSSDAWYAKAIDTAKNIAKSGRVVNQIIFFYHKEEARVVGVELINNDGTSPDPKLVNAKILEYILTNRPDEIIFIGEAMGTVARDNDAIVREMRKAEEDDNVVAHTSEELKHIADKFGQRLLDIITCVVMTKDSVKFGIIRLNRKSDQTVETMEPLRWVPQKVISVSNTMNFIKIQRAMEMADKLPSIQELVSNAAKIIKDPLRGMTDSEDRKLTEMLKNHIEGQPKVTRKPASTTKKPRRPKKP